jgi:hypothetical protein
MGDGPIWNGGETGVCGMTLDLLDIEDVAATQTICVQVTELSSVKYRW